MPLNHIMACISEDAALSTEIACFEALTIGDIMTDLGLSGGIGAGILIYIIKRWRGKKRG